jgi:asparagine synthase (glutamine-hydrolysing)
MCGITGFFVDSVRGHHREILDRMIESLRHRGPDEDGSYVDEHAAVGARRLSIIDVATGRQPVCNEDRTVWAVQNGEIYNFKSLRADLERRGHRFRTASDSEVLVHAYEEWADDCVSHLDGMFALALWDRAKRSLLLARDRMGEKPLYYYAGPETFVFGSELRALLEHPSVPRQLSFESLSRYLAFEYVPAPHSMLAGIMKLAPGHVLTVCPGGKPHVARYWDLSFAPEQAVDEHEWAERLIAQLEMSVRRRLVADVPVGMFLSGGIDSSSIVAMAAASTPRPLKTFTLGFAEPSYDERRFARTISRRFGTDHEEVVLTGDEVGLLLENVGGLLDEPLVDSSFLPIYVLSRLARRSVGVVLSGDGGDELFCGYPTFLAGRAVEWFYRFPRWAQRLATAMVRRWPPSSRYGSAEFLLKQFVRGLPHPPAVRTQLLLGGMPIQEQRALLAAGVRAACAQLDPYDDLASLDNSPALSPIDRLIYQHCKFYLADQNLAVVDRASMASGLEVRAPFLDHAVVELSGRIPPNLKMRGWRTKYILKRALHGIVPDSILGRRKQGLGVPIGMWLRGPLRSVLENRLAQGPVARRGLFDRAAIDRLVREHIAGREDHRKVLWALLMLDAWCDHYLPNVRWT